MKLITPLIVDEFREKEENEPPAPYFPILFGKPSVTENMGTSLRRGSMLEVPVSREPLLGSRPPKSPPPRHSPVPYSDFPVQIPHPYSSLDSLNNQFIRKVHPPSVPLQVSNKDQRLQNVQQPPKYVEDGGKLFS